MSERFMRGDDYDSVVQIWKTCFSDDEGYVRFFWEKCFPMCRGLVWEEEGRVVSMLFMLPGALAYKKSLLPAEYIYAVATLPEHRGCKYAAYLVQYAEIIAKQEGKSALCLLPANPGLYNYYAKLGFRTAFCKQDVSPPQKPLGLLVPHDRQQFVYYAVRRAVWGKQGFFHWPVDMLDYMHQEHIFTGGEVYVQDGATIYLTADGRVKERSVNRPTNEPGGMLLPLDKRAVRWLAQTKGKAYLGLPLD